MDTFFCGPENKKMYGRNDPESPIFKIIGKRARMNAVPLDGVIFSKECLQFFALSGVCSVLFLYYIKWRMHIATKLIFSGICNLRQVLNPAVFFVVLINGRQFYDFIQIQYKIDGEYRPV